MVFGVETMRGCIRKETITIFLLFQPQKLVSNHMLTIFSSMPLWLHFRGGYSHLNPYCQTL